MRVTTNEAALTAALLPGVAAASLRKGAAGREAARSRARVDTGAMRDGIEVTPVGAAGARVTSTVDHSAFNEYGTSRMSAQPFMRPSMDAARVAT